MALPRDVESVIAHHLSEIQGQFKPGAKVLVVVDNGSPATSVIMGDADPTSAAELILELERSGEESRPSGSRRRR